MQNATHIRPKHHHTPPVVQYTVLFVIAFMALSQYGTTAYRLIRGLATGSRGGRPAFSTGLADGRISNMIPPLREQGVRVGDRVISVNGKPYVGTASMLREMSLLKIGDTAAVETEHPDGSRQTAHWHVLGGPPRRRVQTIGSWVTPVLLIAILPLAFLLVGLWVVLAKPRDPSAWLLLGILPYFEALLTPASSQWDWTIWFAPYWTQIAQQAMPVCLMWFGVIFPERASLDRRLPWMKWVLSAPLILFMPLDLIYAYASLWNLKLQEAMAPATKFVTTSETVSSVLCISYFFVLFSYKVFAEHLTGDARRRLRLVFWGAFVGLTPYGAMVVYTLVRNEELSEAFPQWALLSMIFVLAIFPLSLAYVLVVQRAMDLRILIRQGTKYAFARYTLFIFRAAIVAWFSWRISWFVSDPKNHRRAVDFVSIFGSMALFFAFRFILTARLEKNIDRRFFREAYSAELVLSELSEEARNFTEAGPLLETVKNRISDTLHVEKIAIFLRSGDSFRLQAANGIDLSSPVLLPAGSTAITSLAKEKSSAAVFVDDSSSWYVDASEEQRAALSELQTELLVPLPGRGRLIGVMALGPKRSEEAYSRNDRRLLQTVASQTGLALENAELLQSLKAEAAQRERVTRDIEIAREVQERLFPQSPPKFDGVDVAGYCRPAQEIGGDYYDLIEVHREPVDGKEHRPMLGLAVGDVSGKGISAALLMASLRACLRGMTLVTSSDLGALMRHINQIVFEGSTDNRYATFFYAEYDPVTRRLCYANAGHNPPVVLRGEEVIRLEVTGTVVGLLRHAEYQQRDVYLQPGDIVLLYTDGISEAMDKREEEWGEDRMIDALQRERARGAVTAEGMLRALFRQADGFADGAPQHDDMTLVVVRVTGS